MKQQKTILFPKDLIARIKSSNKVPSYHDFTTKLFMLLEMALADSDSKKNEIPIPLVEEKRHAPRHKKAI